MPEYKFRYESQEQLKMIFHFLREDPLEVSLYLLPVVPQEFDDAWGEISHARTSDILPVSMAPEKEKIQEAVEKYEGIARREKIYPFVECEFNGIHHVWPQVRMIFPLLPTISPYEFAEKPLLGLEGFLGKENWRYRQLSFQDIKDPAQIGDVKKFVQREVPERYKINNFAMTLNPRHSTSDHYYTRSEDDGAMYTMGDVIVLRYKKDPSGNDKRNLLESLMLPETGLKLISP